MIFLCREYYIMYCEPIQSASKFDDRTGSCHIKPLLTGSKIRQDLARFSSANLLTICESYLVSSGFVSFKTELYLESKFILTRYWLKCVTDFYSRVLIAQVRISIDLENTTSSKFSPKNWEKIPKFFRWWFGDYFYTFILYR